MSNKPQVTSVDQYNPVDYYNKFFIQEQFDMMEEIKCVKKVGINALSYVLNKSDETKRMIVLSDGFFICEIENKLGLSVGLKYTPFQLLQRFFFNGSFHAACFYVAHDLMGIESQYIRVGVDYCKVITSIDNFGVEREEVKQWNKGTIVDDYGKQALATIPKFDSFTLVPDNKEHNKAVNNKYNVYAKFSHTPMSKKDYEGSGQWKWT